MEISRGQRKHHGVTDGKLMGFVNIDYRGRKVGHGTEILPNDLDREACEQLMKVHNNPSWRGTTTKLKVV